MSKQQEELKADKAVRDQDPPCLGTRVLVPWSAATGLYCESDGNAPLFGNLSALLFGWFGRVLTHLIK